MTSPDGITWTPGVINSSAGQWGDVCFGGGLFIAVCFVGVLGKRAATSPDGITWTLRATPAEDYWNAICYGNGRFVATSGEGTGRTGNYIMTSPAT